MKRPKAVRRRTRRSIAIRVIYQDDARPWIQARTKRTPEWWVALVQRLIQRHSTPSTNPKHDETDAQAWLRDLVDRVVDSAPPGDDYDGNLWAAATLSYVLALWFSRCAHAKSHDPNRPLAHRQAAYERWLAWTHAMLETVVDTRRDHAFFPGQRWQSPFDPDATSGKFV